MSNYIFQDIVVGKEGLLKGPFGSDLKKSLYVSKGDNTYKVYLQENILLETLEAGNHYISSEYYESKMKRYAVKENDFIVTCDGTLGEIYQLKGLKEAGIISSSLLRITLNPEIVDYDYFYYLFKVLIKKELITQGNNSALKHLPSIDVIRNHKIFLPELSTQKKIGKILKDYDLKIRNNNKINSELESMAKTLYDYWFLQFEFPNEEGKPYKSSGGKMVWNEELKRIIPEGWEVVPFLKVAYWETNSQPPKSDFIYEPKIGYVRFIQNRDYDSSNYKTYIPLTKSLSIVNKFDILMDKYGDAGTVRYGIEGAFNVALAKIGVHKANMQEYIRSYLSSKPIYTYLHNACMASTRASLSEENLKHLNILIPSKEMLDLFEKNVNAIRRKILTNTKEKKELASLRDFLLPLLMNGQAHIE